MEHWLQGMYFFDAVSCSLQNAFRKQSDPPAKYPEKPYGTPEKQETEQDPETREEQERLKAKLYMHQLKWSAKNWGGS